MVELLVGMLIAMLATLIIMQVYETFEGQKRTTTGGADAQTNGTIALYNLQREISIGGYGLPVFSTRNPGLLCDPLPSLDTDGDPATAGVGMYPVLLADGGNGPDAITVTYGTTATGGVPISATVAGPLATVANNLACKVDDVVLLTNGASCAMATVASLAGTTGITLDATPAVTSGNIACMGAWNEVAYTVANNTLMRNGVSNVAGIVNLQAQYGVSDNPNSNTITQWVNPTGEWAFARDPADVNVIVKPDLAHRNRIKAIRVAVVARSGLWEKEVVSTACTSTAAANPTGVCAWEGIDLADPGIDSPAPALVWPSGSDWDHYRYRVFDVIAPLRNVIWSHNTLPTS